MSQSWKIPGKVPKTKQQNFTLINTHHAIRLLQESYAHNLYRTTQHRNMHNWLVSPAVSAIWRFDSKTHAAMLQ